MKFEYVNKKSDSFFGLTDNLKKDEPSFCERAGLVKMLWNMNTRSTGFYIDDRKINLEPNQILTTTFFHHLTFEKSTLPLTCFLFNREFYCLNDHDHEVSCNGILFYGTQDIPIIKIPGEQDTKFKLLYKVFIDEFNTPDKVQGDMLQMLLKRLIIICTRLAKEQLLLKKIDHAQVDIVRRFNFLVDIHFKTKRQVSDYADLLNKSPKTLANLFSQYNQKTPHQIIHERVALEARRLLLFSEKSTKQISFDLGFEEPTHFSKFFKKLTGFSPTEYRKNRAF
jgi:AraC family 4-hydroxyphenylacetate 3-monooxygenase operon regulatory protein